jgi:hypothetical protein
MHTFIRMDIMPYQIDPHAWKEVYAEALALVRAYPFLDHDLDGNIRRTQERELLIRTDRVVGWRTSGDLRSMTQAQSFSLVQDLHFYRNKGSDHIDHYDDILHAGVFDHFSKKDQQRYAQPSIAVVFDARTNLLPYHIPLLAIACLIEHRFPRHAMVYGDIELEQMKQATDWATSILQCPILLPERADQHKLLDRITPMFRQETGRLAAFLECTLHPYDQQLDAFVRSHFRKKTIERTMPPFSPSTVAEPSPIYKSTTKLPTSTQ